MSGLLDEIKRRYLDGNHVHAVIFELTERCPCDCTHCYLIKEPRNELSLAEVTDALGQFRDAGAFNLTLTGGDPLTRKDFFEILAEALRLQFFTCVLTTGLLIDRKTADRLAEHQVKSVEVSLLGDNPATHDALMRRPGSFETITHACRLMVERGIPVVIKTTIMQENYREVERIAAFARELGAEYSGSVTIAPREDGDRAPQSHALTRDQLRTLDPELLFGGLIPGEDYSGGGLMTCRAGKTVAAVSSTGDVFPCIMFRRLLGNLREQPLREFWLDSPDPFLTELRGIRDADVETCPECGIRAYCRRCPGMAWTETGALRKPGPSFCEMAEGLADIADDV